MPPVCRAYSQLNRAARAFPMCIIPVGAGEKRTLISLGSMRLRPLALHNGAARFNTRPEILRWLRSECTGAGPPSGLDGEQLPVLGQALQLELAARLEGQAGAGDDVADRAGDEHLVATGIGRDPRRDVHREAREIVAAALALAGVDARRAT